LSAQWFPEWAAWWVVMESGTLARRLYGPFSKDEALLSDQVHGAGVKTLHAGQ
jgi:hypothetical protein